MRKRVAVTTLIILTGLCLAACGATLETATPAPAPAVTATPTEEVATATPIPIVTRTEATNTSASLPTATTAGLFAVTPVPTVASPFTPTPTQISPTASSTQAIAVPSLAANVIIAPTPTPEQRSAQTIASPSPTNQPSPTPALNPTSLPVTKNGPDTEEQNFLNQLNSFRQANGRGPLTFDPLLFNSARWMAQDMASKNYVAHKDSQGRDIVQRIKAFGYPGNWVGENIAGGFEHADDNLKIWQSDDIHKNNLLGANYTKAGVGRYYQKGSLNGWYWVLDLG